MEEAQMIRVELYNIQQSLSSGEQEKVELMKSLACLKDDLTRLQHSESSLDVSSAVNPLDKFSTASQTDLSGEVIWHFAEKNYFFFFSKIFLISIFPFRKKFIFYFLFFPFA